MLNQNPGSTIVHLIVTDPETRPPAKSRLAVRLDGDKISTTHIGGKAPRLTSSLLWKALEAVGVSIADALNLSTETRKNPFKVVRRVGMSGATDWKLIIRRNDDTRDYPCVALIHESMNWKLNDSIRNMWIGDFAEIAQAIENFESFSLSEFEKQEFSVFSPPAWDELRGVHDECAFQADAAALRVIMHMHKTEPCWQSAKETWFNSKGNFGLALASYVLAGGEIFAEEIEKVKSLPRPSTGGMAWSEELDAHWRAQCEANAAAMVAVNESGKDQRIFARQSPKMRDEMNLAE